MPKLTLTLVVTREIELVQYQAETCEEAKANFEKWLADGSIDPIDEIGFGDPYTVEVKVEA